MTPKCAPHTATVHPSVEGRAEFQRSSRLGKEVAPCSASTTLNALNAAAAAWGEPDAKRVARTGSAMTANVGQRPPAIRWLLSVLPRSWGVSVLAALVVVAGVGGAMAVARRATTGRLVTELRTAVEDTELGLPRVERHAGTTTYWVPNMVSTSKNPAFILVYQDLLLNVNQDSSAPVCTLSDVSLVPVGDDVAAMTRARCAGFLGRVWSKVITAYVPLRHFASK